nr:putative Gag-Pol polyprotein [Tanacetum cinerariifolium]
VRTASIPIETQKPLVKDEEAVNVDVYLYRSMIGSSMYLTASRPDIMFAETYFMAMQKANYYGYFYFRGRISTLVKGRLLEVTTVQESKELASSKQTALEQMAAGKETSNPLMADSLPKTILLTFIHGICIDMDSLEFLLVYLVVTSVFVMNKDMLVNTPRCDEDSLELKELMIFFVQLVLRKMELELLLLKVNAVSLKLQLLSALLLKPPPGMNLAAKNFDRDDLKTLWKLVKERFKTTEPKNFSNDFLLNILKIMFEKPNIKANVWKDQKGRYGLAKVKSWKLFESCGFHIITFTTTQMFLLVEKKYPLTHFTLQQMLNNVRLKVKEESEMFLELLRLVRRKLNEGYVPE